jgi:hypothetical protein
MFLSTLVTLVIVPIYYILFDRFGSYVAFLARRDREERIDEQKLHPPHVAVGPIHVGERNGVVQTEPEREFEPVMPLRVEPLR